MRYTLKIKIVLTPAMLDYFLNDCKDVNNYRYENGVLSITRYANMDVCLSFAVSVQDLDYCEILSMSLIKGDK
jgi:hypothetical protein